MNLAHAYSVYKYATSESKWEVLKYSFKRAFGFRGKFTKPVYLKANDCIFDCGLFPAYALTVCPYFEENTTKEILKLKSGTFVDIGANTGKYAIQVAKNNPKVKVIAIEPDAENYKMLLKNILLNKSGDITPFQYACCESYQVLKFYRDSLHPTTNALQPIDQGDEVVEVQGMALDDVLANTSNIKLIKMDVEGAEIRVLQGAVKTLAKYHPDIIFEAWDNNKYREIRRFLIQRGYKRFDNLGEYNYKARFKKEQDEWERLQKEIKDCKDCHPARNCREHEADSRVLEWGIETLDELKKIIGVESVK